MSFVTLSLLFSFTLPTNLYDAAASGWCCSFSINYLSLVSSENKWEKNLFKGWLNSVGFISFFFHWVSEFIRWLFHAQMNFGDERLTLEFLELVAYDNSRPLNGFYEKHFPRESNSFVVSESLQQLFIYCQPLQQSYAEGILQKCYRTSLARRLRFVQRKWNHFNLLSCGAMLESERQRCWRLWKLTLARNEMCENYSFHESARYDFILIMFALFHPLSLWEFRSRNDFNLICRN